MNNSVLCIDIGGSSVKYGFASSNGTHQQLLAPSCQVVEYDATDPDSLGHSIAGIVGRHRDVSHVILAVPGIVNEANLVTSFRLNWRDFDILNWFQSRYGLAPSLVISDASAIGYAASSQLPELDNYIALGLGTGVGGQIVRSGEVIQSIGVGHTELRFAGAPNLNCPICNRSCLEIAIQQCNGGVINQVELLASLVDQLNDAHNCSFSLWVCGGKTLSADFVDQFQRKFLDRAQIAQTPRFVVLEGLISRWNMTARAI